MASTRYGQIHHGHIHNNIKFPSPAAREAFAEECKKYHAVLNRLLETLGQVGNQVDRDNLCVSVYEAFEEYEGVSQREQLSILIDSPLTLVTGTEVNA